MSIFKKVTPLELLQAKSENAVSLIRNTINKLKATNEAIAAEHEANDVKIANLQTTNEAIMDDHALCAVLARSLDLIDFNLFYQFTKDNGI